MAFQSITGGLWLPSPFIGLLPIHAVNTFLLDAASEIVALIFQAPKSGDIDRFDFNLSVSNSPDNGLRASLQSVSTTTGLPTGTILGATNNAFVTYAHTVTTGWKSTNFAEVATVTRGDVLAAVVDIPSFTAGDNVGVFRTSGLARVNGFPYGVSSISTKEVNYLPNIAIHYTDGYNFIAPQFQSGVLAMSSVAYNVDTGTADEWGMAFSLPFAFKLNAVHSNMSVAAGANFKVVVYDGDGTTVLADLAHDGDIAQGTGETQYTFFLESELELDANTTYRVTIQPSTTNNVTLRYWTFNSIGLMSTWEGGSALYMTSQIGVGGTWTDYNSGTFRRPNMSLLISAIDTGGGGGLNVLGGRGGVIT